MSSKFSLDELCRNKLQVIQENIVPDKFDDAGLPTDVHIIHYSVGGDTYFDAVRSHSMVDIFDSYYDHLKGIGVIQSIKSGYGRVKPRAYKKMSDSDFPE